MTSQQFLICDSSTFANFSGWASAISAFLAACGWAQSTDTGQVMWSGMSITALSMAGSVMTCTYSSQTGLALAIGRTLTVTGWTGGNTGNNGTFVITGGTLAAGSGTFTATNASGVNVASGGTGVVTIASSAPAGGAYVYEVWTPNDSLTNFYFKVEYGNDGTAAQPALRLTLSSSTNGAGTATGIVAGPQITQTSASGNSATIPYECDFSGAAGRFSVMLWRNGGGNMQQLISVERSVNSSGAYTGTYATLWTLGLYSGNSGASQRTLYFGVGSTYLPTSTNGGWGVIVAFQAGSVNAFNGSIPISNAQPMVGFWDYPCTTIALGGSGDLTEGVPFQTTLYGSTRTYMPGKVGPFLTTPNNDNTNGGCVCMRYD